MNIANQELKLLLASGEIVSGQNSGVEAFDTEAEALEHFEVEKFTSDVIERYEDGSVLIHWQQ